MPQIGTNLDMQFFDIFPLKIFHTDLENTRLVMHIEKKSSAPKIHGSGDYLT